MSRDVRMPMIIPRMMWRRSRFEKRCHWSRVELLALQSAATTELRSFAMKHSPFYRRFHRGLEDRPLSELPVLTNQS